MDFGSRRVGKIGKNHHKDEESDIKKKRKVKW